MEEFSIHWTDYMKNRVHTRGFEIAIIEHIVRYSEERYTDVVTGRQVVVGRHNQDLVMIPYEQQSQMLIPVTIHLTSRQQIGFRLMSRRLII